MKLQELGKICSTMLIVIKKKSHLLLFDQRLKNYTRTQHKHLLGALQTVGNLHSSARNGKKAPGRPEAEMLRHHKLQMLNIPENFQKGQTQDNLSKALYKTDLQLAM